MMWNPTSNPPAVNREATASIPDTIKRVDSTVAINKAPTKRSFQEKP